VIDVFLADAPSMLARLKQAAAAGDVTELGAAAHAIKGSAGLFSQGTAYEQARALEQRARSGDGGDAARACDEIDAAVALLLTELRALRATL
jgi:HPt (histidine-containing phosphotransfer) domain-containing protein